jgi:hypothetical protein
VETRSERLTRLLANSGLLKVAITPDRETYLPGEVGVVTITVENPTPDALEIPDPKDLVRIGRVQNCFKGGPDSFTYGTGWSCPQHETTTPQPKVSSTTIRPSEQIVVTIRSDERFGGFDLPAIGGGDMGITEGTYRLRYPLGGEHLYQVQAGKLESSTTAVLHEKASYISDTGKQVSATLKVIVLALQSGGDHLILVSGHEVSGDPSIRSDDLGKLSENSARIASPLFRVGKAEQPVVSITATTGEDDRITIDYLDQDGKHHRIPLGKNRRSE